MKPLYPPFGDPTDLPRKVLVFAPHPDDEVFGCGGLLAFHADAKASVRVVIVSDGTAGDPSAKSTEIAQVRVAEARAGAEVLGLGADADYRFLGLPDGKLGEVGDLVEHLARELEEFDPDLVYGPSVQELHPDHRALANALCAAVARGRERRVFFYDVNLQVQPSVLFDVTPIYARKIAAVERLASQLAYQDLVTKGKAFDAARPASRVTVHTAQSAYDDLLIPLAGRVQGTNAACAIAAAEAVLPDRLDVRHVRDALAALDWPGRMQAFPGEPTVILDGAHNADSLARLLDAVAEYYPDAPKTVVFASAADKDIAGMMRVLADDEAPVIFTRTDNPRAADPEELADALRASGGTVLDSCPEPADALRSARENAGPPGLVVVCGSLYLVGAVLAAPDRFGLA